MPAEGEVWVQLATRIPKHLHRELKLHCVKSDVSVMEFVVKALEEKLQREAGGRSERRRARA
jgi:predicted HicB family RNase H-like nuclease